MQLQTADQVVQSLFPYDETIYEDEEKYHQFCSIVATAIRQEMNTTQYWDWSESFKPASNREELANYIYSALSKLNLREGQVLPSEEEILNSVGIKRVASGMIKFTGRIPKNTNIFIDREANTMGIIIDPKTVDQEVDLGDGATIVHVPGSRTEKFGQRFLRWFSQLFTDDDLRRHTYFYDLKGWTSKYSKPYEFLATLHLATMAPEFAYDIATAPETDATVEIQFKKVEVELALVLNGEFSRDKGNVSDAIGGESVDDITPEQADQLERDQENGKENDVEEENKKDNEVEEEEQTQIIEDKIDLSKDITAVDQAMADIMNEIHKIENKVAVLAKIEAIKLRLEVINLTIYKNGDASQGPTDIVIERAESIASTAFRNDLNEYNNILLPKYRSDLRAYNREYAARRCYRK